ncbi:MAG: hypothetical protein Q8N99_01955, partial [Nanoarchaeota archaeon]|nr:hypothetical protein [Nanoarchaeota archaeon]
MTENEIKKLKEELIKSYWTEDLHLKLTELQAEDAKRIVESMDNFEIFEKVNNRQYQQDYIEDYLEYLWKISEPAYW